MTTSNVARWVCAGLAIALPVPLLWAQTLPPAAQQPVASAGFDAPVGMAALESHRGGSQLVHNDMELAGTTAGNTASQLVTGGNAIGAGAFANMNGLPVVIQNSGANVLIQNAVIVHLQMD